MSIQAPVAIGIDPDLHNLGVGIVEGDTAIFGRVLTVSRALKGKEAAVAMAHRIATELPDILRRYRPDRAIVEAQMYYLGKSPARPQDIIHLALVAGAATQAITSFRVGEPVDLDPVRLVYPRDWKGSVPKGIHQGRVCTALGIRFKSKGPTVPVKVTDHEIFKDMLAEQHSHVVDALGLALWSNEKGVSRYGRE